MGWPLFVFVLLSFLIPQSCVFASYESLDIEIVDAIDHEFAKDISSIIVESTLKSKCDGNVFVVTKECENYISHVLISLSDWAPPLILVSWKDFEKMTSTEKDSWNLFLSWKRRPCSLIFICDLMRHHPITIGTNDSDTMIKDHRQKLGYLNFAKFFTSHDQILYFSDPLMIHVKSKIKKGPYTSDREIQAKLLKQTGILLSIRVTNRSETPESVMQIFSRCDFCGPVRRRQEVDLGTWQRNKTQFGKFFEVFDSFAKISFNNSNLNIGYFNYPPHFTCAIDINKYSEITTCAGVEWEMISQIGKSLQFNFTLTHIGQDISSAGSSDPTEGKFNPITNISGMIEALQDEKIDLAVGGISVTSERIALVDFSKVFANEPIVFVVKKPKNIFVLGIWLAFQPAVWPFILLLIGIISYLFRVIINRKIQPPSGPNKMQKLSLSIYLDSIDKIPDKKPSYVQIFESLEITLQPLLGQPLNPSQISSNPRRLLKLLLVIWWFSCLIITTLYNTGLITSLINPVTTKEAESLQDLIDSGYRFKLGCTKGSVYELIASAIDQEVPEDEQKLSRGDQIDENIKEEAKMIKLLKQIRERLIIGDSETYSLIAYIIEESAVNGITSTWNNKDIGFSEIKIIRERLFLTGYGFALKPQAAYKEKIDTALARLGAGGLIDHWYSEFTQRQKKATESKFRLRTQLGQIHLNLEILQGAFIFLLFGCSFAGAVFGIEHLTKRYNFKFFTRKQILSFLKLLWSHFMSFYSNHLAQKPLAVKRNKNNQEKFRTVVNTVVMLNTLSTDSSKPYGKFLK